MGGWGAKENHEDGKMATTWQDAEKGATEMKRTEEQEWVVAAANTAAQILISQGRRRQLGGAIEH